MGAVADPIGLGLLLAYIFDSLGVRYVVGGSVASSLLGEDRTTQDVDIVAELEMGHVTDLLAAFHADFYVAESAVRDAINRRSSFNVIHLPSSLKADIFVLGEGPLERLEMDRRLLLLVDREPERSLYVASPEDIVVQKLKWYRMGREVSDRQWRDILGVLKAGRDGLDFGYMQSWAARIGLSDLYDRALREAGL